MQKPLQHTLQLKRSGSREWHWLLGGAAILLPLLLGGARPSFWSPIAGLFLIGVSILIWVRPLHAFPLDVPKRTSLLLGFLVSYACVQALPLPPSWLEALSPHRLFWLRTAAEATRMPLTPSSISYMPLVTAFSGLWWFFLVLYGLLLRHILRNDNDRSWFFLILFYLAGFEGFYGLLQMLIPSLGAFWNTAVTGEAHGTFVNRNHYAAFLGMAWPILLAYTLALSRPNDRSSSSSSFALREQSRQLRQKQIFLAFVTGLVLVGLFFSQSRGAILSALIALTVFVSFGGTRQKNILFFVAGCWLVMIAYGSIIGFEAILIRFDHISDDAMGRFAIWRDTLKIIEDHPLTGTGLGSYGTVFRLYQTYLPDTLEACHAHNDYLQLVAELGLPTGIGMILIVWAYWWWTAITLRRERPGKRARERSGPSIPRDQRLGSSEKADGGSGEERRMIRIGALAAAAAFLCHSWVEFNWQIPANQFYFVTMLVLMRL